MQAAKDAGDLDAMMSNARLNWKLWTIFQSELLDPHCPVPEDIRTNVLTLANFVDRQTVDFLTRRQPELLDILITIDRNLAMGLYAEVTDATPGATAAVAGLEKGISA